LAELHRDRLLLAKATNAILCQMEEEEEPNRWLAGECHCVVGEAFPNTKTVFPQISRDFILSLSAAALAVVDTRIDNKHSRLTKGQRLSRRR
jgi:hypothetical protein